MDITVNAFAKVNLFLAVTGKRADGYHDIKSVMHTLDLHDSVEIRLLRKPGIFISSNRSYIPCDSRNIAYKAARLFFSELGSSQGLNIRIIKRIPVCGGLGGSSTDGAAVLSGLNTLLGKPFSDIQLLSLAAKLSADMPFCLKGGAALCEGIGDVITPLPPMQECFAVIVKPRFSLNTKSMYAQYDLLGDTAYPDCKNVIMAIKANDIHLLSKSLYNSFEPVAEVLKPTILSVKETLMKEGALSTLMSGSGSCVFGLFECKDAADSTRERLSERRINAYSVKLQ